jgi:hypothetical protein
MLMIKPLNRSLGLAFFLLGLFCPLLHAQFVKTVGITQLQALNTNLNGSGIRVAQPEAVNDTNNDWEMDPTNIPQPNSLFTYFTNGASTNSYPNALSGDSGHADAVGQCFYGPGTEVDPNGPLEGAATNVAHVDDYEADYFYGDIIAAASPANIHDSVVNQSFTFGQLDTTDQQTVDSQYDNYSMKYQTLFVSAVNNGGPVCAPGTSYDCIGVGAYHGNSSYGPTIDNGRCKPDIVTPGLAGDTSFTTPYVSGSATVLMQAGLRGDGGGDTNSAANMITVKALLMNGAVKPADWMNHPPEPLDTNYGAGVLNVFNSYEELAAGKHGYNFSTNIPTGTAHPPVATAASVPILNGWDYNTNISSTNYDAVKHYFFNVTNSISGTTFTLTATLIWNRHHNSNYETGPLGINNLFLFLYNAANSNLVGSSTSVVDNVQQVFVPQLPQGRYDLQVWKAGGAGIISTNESYALAWEMFSDFLSVKQYGTNVCLTWPAYPAGFAVAEAASLNAPVSWSTNGIPGPVYTNNENVIWMNPGNNEEYFRLQTPDF